MRMKRIIASILVKDGIAVQSLGFNKYLPVGKPEILASFLSTWGADEIVLLDISASKNNRSIDPGLVAKVATQCFVPLSVGGGIKSRKDISLLLKNGADKVCINSIIQDDFLKIEDFAAEFGAQCIIASVDYKLNASSKQYETYDYLTKKTKKPLFDHITALSKASIGEILLQNVERDGALKGFDVETFQKISATSNLPIIAMSGAGEPAHFKELFSKSAITSAAAGNMFSYIEQSITILKANLALLGVTDIRMNENDSYLKHGFQNGRIQAPSEDYLENLLFEKLEKEII